jgi:glycosyltransferase involved in cell wall biosynthesis
MGENEGLDASDVGFQASASTVVNAGFRSAPKPDQSEGSETGRDKSRATVIAPNCSPTDIVDVPWPRVSVVIPALNEARNLPYVFAQIPRTVHEVILVDGRSVDNTVAVARELWPDVHVVTQNRTGKGNALACGFAAATGDVIAMIDADGSADPGEIPAFVSALLDGADFAKGTRSGDGGGSEDLTRLRHAGNRVLSALFNACYKTRYSDLCYGYNVFWRRCLSVLRLDSTTLVSDDTDGRLWGDGFEIETLIHTRIAKSGLKVTEVPSFERSRIHGVSNLNAIRDGIRVVRTILTERRRIQRSNVAATVSESVFYDNDASPTGQVISMKDRNSDLIFDSNHSRG